ncbi:MAG TPA: ATP-dependent DNA helicase [Steroidobacteraceae bacterium]|jgi:ATP-dependent DNA helicase DinG|nr:ATP-dependent DNA helicase [Steroidobacteraceae bacterium]
MNSDYNEVFNLDGPLARALPGYAYRPEQAAMAKAVGLALARLEPLIVEAGTGTGKTFAYLVPALLSGHSVIISTGTRTLQDQLFRRDVPLLARALGLPAKIALLKGRANYLCRHRLELATQQGSLLGGERGVARTLGRILRWAATTKAGDLSELTDLPEQSPVWPQITSTRENCLGQECPQFARCHVFEARRNAQAADIVVVNHHLLLADLALKDEGFGDLLPGADAVILDEAHQVPDIAAQFFGQHWSARQVQLLMRDITAEMAAVGVRAPAIAAAVAEVDGRLEELRTTLQPGPRRHEWASLPDSFLDVLPELETALSGIAAELEALGAGAGTANCARRAAVLANSLAHLSELPDDTGLRWVDAGPSGLLLQFTPFEIAERLREYVESRPCAWVFTSATLAIGEDFSHFAARIGLPDARTVRIDSPFDYRVQARIFLPPHMPEPQSPAFAARFIDACAPLLEASGGRAFLLYTSYRGLAEGVRALQARFPNPPFPVLVQGEAPREALLSRFRELGNAVLLATGSFWEGVDVKGEALSIVAIDKLPFASPDDPLLKARLTGIRRRGGNPFFEYQLPQAVLALKQGVGRLIRDIEDFGVIVIGDPRISTKAYGRVFLEALPSSPVITESAVGALFLAERLAKPDPAMAQARRRALRAT